MPRDVMQQSQAARYLGHLLPALADGSRTYTPLQLFFLARLAELVRLRLDTLAKQPEDKFRLGLVNRALFSTYMDCIRLNVGDEARQLVASQGIKRATPER